jgi:transcriptional regulator with XRE-family HTH domain
MTSQAAELGRFIANRRAHAALLADELAREAGVDESTLMRWENGEAVPSAAQLARLSHALQVPMDDLFARAGSPVPDPNADRGPTGFTP